MKKRFILLVLIITTIISCQQRNKIVQGDIYFKQYDFGKLYNADKKRIEKIRKSLDSLREIKDLPENIIERFNFFDKLERNDILESPYIKVRTDSTILQIFLSEKEYEKIERFEHSDLINRKRKVSIQLEITELEKDLFYSDKIIDYKEIYGQTYWKK